MADRVVLMRDGRIEQNGSPEDLYLRPASAFTARFIGTPPMNVIKIGEQQIGVRPEDVRLVGEGGHQAHVQAVEHLGADSIILCDVDGQRIAIRQDGFSKVAPRDQVRIAWDTTSEHRFDPSSGLRLEGVREQNLQTVVD